MKSSIVSILLRAFLKWWWLVAIATALGVGVGFLVRTEQPDVYFSTATVIIGEDPRTVQDGYFYSSYTLLSAYSVFARRPTVLQPVIDDLGLNVPPEVLNGRLNVDTNDDASLLEITVMDVDPDRAATIANRIAIELVNQSAGGTSSDEESFVRSQMQDIENQITQLQTQLNQLIQESSTLTSAFDINQNLQDQTTTRNAIAELRQLYVDLSAGAGSGQGAVRLLERATPSQWPVSTNSIMDLVFAGLAGLILSVVTVVLITFFDDRLQWEESDQDTILDQKILGPLGIVPANKLPLYSLSMPNSVEVEALRQVRANIALAGKDGHQPRVITVVSYDSGDGKTLTTANLALTYAIAGEKTLVIDADMRKGDLHELFGLPNVRGLSDLLASKTPFAEALPQVIMETEHEDLYMMPYGRSNIDPAALLSKPRYALLIETLRQRFDVIVIDSVPTIGGPDAAFIAEATDGAVIVVRARRTTMTGLKRTINNLQSGHNPTILGVVFNRVRLQVTTRYSTNYYRSFAPVNPERLSAEISNPGQRRLPLRASVTVDKAGVRWYSVAATATQLGVRKQMVREWCQSGYLKGRRDWLRRWWVNEEDINRMLQPFNTPVEPVMEDKKPAPVAENGASSLPNQLREQRAALLDFVNNPTEQDS